MTPMTSEQALKLLGDATEPQNIPRLTRSDFVNINAALVVVDAALKELAELKNPKPQQEKKTTCAPMPCTVITP
jgi:hypothetical protein